MNRRRVFVVRLGLLMIALNAPGTLGAAGPQPAPARLVLSFKMDPRLATGPYGGERWVSPTTYTRVGDANGCTIEVRAQGVAADGRPVATAALSWTSSKGETVTLSPSEGSQITLTVTRAGDSTVRVSAGDVARELIIKATRHEDIMRVEITQR